MRFPLRLDVLAIGDFRVGDNAAASHLAALLALSDAGYRVGLLNVVGSAAADPFRLTEGLGQAFASGRLLQLGPGAGVDCAVALAFDARIFVGRQLGGIAVQAAHRFVTVDRQAPFDSAGPDAIARLRAGAEIALGGPCVWVPSSLPARAALAMGAPHFDIAEEDWPLVAPALSERPDTDIERLLPVIGVGRIAECRAWPDGSVAWAHHAPDLAQIAVRVLGAPRDAALLRTGREGPLELWPKDSQTFGAFLNRIGYLANADIAAADPCPVEALHAMAAGVIPVLEPEYRPVFGPAAIYARPRDIARTVIDLFSDKGVAGDIRAVQRDMLAQVRAPGRFVDRIRAIARPRRDVTIVSGRAARPHRHVLMFSTNGVGMGHLTRQLAVARRLPEQLTPVFVSHSPAVRAVREFGYTAEFLPYHASYGGARPHWNAGLQAVLSEMFGFYRPAALVFDGNVPFLGLVAALEKHPEVAPVWMRRAMWGDYRDLDALERGGTFDVVIEPGEIAGAYDTGPTVTVRDRARPVPPVHLLDAADLLSREEAAAELGLDPAGTNALILPGSGNNFDAGAMVRAAVDALAADLPGNTVIAEWLIASDRAPWPASARVVRGYPVVRWIRAFDFAVSAAGYNSFTELTLHGLPAIWMPNVNPEMDRQDLRAAFARDTGIGLAVPGRDPGAMRQAVRTMLDPAARRGFAERLGAIDPANGAAEAARIVADLAASNRTARA